MSTLQEQIDARIREVNELQVPYKIRIVLDEFGKYNEEEWDEFEEEALLLKRRFYHDDQDPTCVKTEVYFGGNLVFSSWNNTVNGYNPQGGWVEILDRMMEKVRSTQAEKKRKREFDLANAERAAEEFERQRWGLT